MKYFINSVSLGGFKKWNRFLIYNIMIALVIFSSFGRCQINTSVDTKAANFVSFSLVRYTTPSGWI